MGREINFSGLIQGLYSMRSASTVSDGIGVMKAIAHLRKVGTLPEAYVDGIQDELLQLICQPIPQEVHVNVYLTFHGLENRASFLKIGVARNVRSRMKELSTGNPLPRIWTFASGYSSRQKAMKVERALLEHMSHSRVNGEWVQVHGLSFDAAEAVVASLAEVASAAVSEPADFLLGEH